MKKLFTLFVLLCFAFATQAQTETYIVSFTDKKNNSFTVEQACQFLSQQAIERRAAQGIAINETDLPVSPAYLSQLSGIGGKVLLVLKWQNLAIVEVPADNKPAIENLPFVQSVTPLNNERHAVSDKFKDETFTSTPSAPLAKGSADLNYGASFNQISMLNGVALHNAGFRGEGMTIAVLDAGFADANSLNTFDSLWNNDQIIDWHNFAEPGGDIFNSYISTHGSRVLSTMGGYLDGQLIGTAPKANYYLLRTEDAEAEYIMEEYYWAAGAEYADSVGADIINSSLGYTTFDNPGDNHTYADMDGNTTPITIAADYAASKGILVVNSAGNSGNDTWLYIGAPADGDSVMAIAAVDPEGNYASFSSLGPSADGRIKPDVAAQGQDAVVVSMWGFGVDYANGTSFASPIMAGMSACLWQAHPGYNNMEIYEAIIQSASQYNMPDFELGYGIPDFEAAHNMLTQQAANILAFSIPEQTEATVIDRNTHEIFIEVGNSVDLSTVVAEFTLSDGASAYIGDNEQISGETVNDFTQPLTYTIVAQDAQTEKDWTVTIGVLASVPQIEAADFKLFPNPAADQLTLQFPEKADITIYDLLGNALLSQTVDSNEQQIAVGHLPPGTYIVKIHSNRHVFSRKIVIE